MNCFRETQKAQKDTQRFTILDPNRTLKPMEAR